MDAFEVELLEVLTAADPLAAEATDDETALLELVAGCEPAETMEETFPDELDARLLLFAAAFFRSEFDGSAFPLAPLPLHTSVRRQLKREEEHKYEHWRTVRRIAIRVVAAEE